jgi:hypothetical protein
MPWKWFSDLRHSLRIVEWLLIGLHVGIMTIQVIVLPFLAKSEDLINTPLQYSVGIWLFGGTLAYLNYKTPFEGSRSQRWLSVVLNLVLLFAGTEVLKSGFQFLFLWSIVRSCFLPETC